MVYGELYFLESVAYSDLSRAAFLQNSKLCSNICGVVFGDCVGKESGPSERCQQTGTNYVTFQKSQPLSGL